MYELTADEVRAIVVKVAEEKNLKSQYDSKLVNYAINFSTMEIIGWDTESKNPSTSLYDTERGLYMHPTWRPDVFHYEDEDEEDLKYFYVSVEEAVYYGAQHLLEICVEGEPKLGIV